MATAPLGAMSDSILPGRLASALALLLGSLAAAASAQAPVDVPEVEAMGELPAPPEGFLRAQHGAVTWEYPARASSVIDDLAPIVPSAWARLERELGADVEDTLRVRVGTNPDEMRRLAPARAPPPPYASGVAYPARGLVLLTLTAPESWDRPDLERVLVHELAHVVLFRAAGGRAVPRWLTEGVAIHQAGEASLERVRVLGAAAVAGRVIPLEQLSAGFPSRPHQVNLAYAESADFVRWLLDREDGAERFGRLMASLRAGDPFERAVRRAYAMTLPSLELGWRESLSERFQALPLLIGSGGLWTLVSLLLIVAYLRRRRQRKKTLAKWEADEQLAARTAQVLLAQSPARATAGPSPTAPEDDHEVLYVVPPEPRFRETGVPTIEHDGRSHTLH